MLPPTPRKLLAIGTVGAVLTTGGLWVAGSYRHQQDRLWCRPPGPIYVQAYERVVAQLCVDQREDRRWGPFLVFGPGGSDGPGRDPSTGEDFERD